MLFPGYRRQLSARNENWLRTDDEHAPYVVVSRSSSRRDAFDIGNGGEIDPAPLYDKPGVVGRSGNGGGKVQKNAAPQAGDDTFQASESGTVAGDLLANDVDRDGDALSVVAVDGVALIDDADGTTIALASGALLAIRADGTFSYDPNGAFDMLHSGETAVDGVEYMVSDGRGGFSRALLTITVEGSGSPTPNTAPVARDDVATTDEATALAGHLLANDTDPDGDALTVLAVGGDAAAVGRVLALASGASLTIQANGDFRYDPSTLRASLAAGESAVDTVAYTVSDGRGGADMATATFTVTGVAERETAYYIDALIADEAARWNADGPLGAPVRITFGFAEAVPDYYETSAPERLDFRPFDAAQREAARGAFAGLEAFTAIEFDEAPYQQATIVLGRSDLPSGAGWAYLPTPGQATGKGGDVWLDSVNADNAALVAGGDGYKTLIHEIGHALGLKHPHVDPRLPEAEDNRQFTVMSYREHPGTVGVEPRDYMLYDVAALQHLYGAGPGASAGDDAYDLSGASDLVTTIWDAGGNDALDARSAVGDVRLDLRAGEFSSAGTARGWYALQNNVAIAYGSVIENASAGAGDDVLIGNAADNVLEGGAGADRFVFHASFGADTIVDFERGVDLVDMTATGANFDTLFLTSEGEDLRVSFEDDAITFRGVETLMASDFVFALIG